MNRSQMKSISALFTLLISTLSIVAQDITPRPVKITMAKGRGFEMDQSTRIIHDDFFTQQAGYFAEQISQQCGINLQTSVITAGKLHGQNILLLHDSILVTKPEMYLLEVIISLITVKANNVRGIVNGMQSLLQLLPLGKTDAAIYAAADRRLSPFCLPGYASRRGEAFFSIVIYKKIY